ncbi:MAG: VWA domain-containing protein [Candidatus Pacebacteria bacterium]|nr:VWA domain-containing protein [Candidatus Paceibacterota bacterium]
MERQILAFGSDGKPVIRDLQGRESSVPAVSSSDRRPGLVYLLLDCSGSMEGDKLEQVKAGALDFAQTAIRKGYLVGLIQFDSGARLVCELTGQISLIASGVEKLFAAGNTDMAGALWIAFQKLMRQKGQRVVVVATDGYPSNTPHALQAAEQMKKDKIEILAISTQDAHQNFLGKIVSRKDLNLTVSGNNFRQGMEAMAKKLPVQSLEYKE